MASTYRNETERNIHIFASSAAPTALHPDIYGGFYSFPSNNVTGKILHEWMRLISRQVASRSFLLYYVRGGKEKLAFDAQQHVYHKDGRDKFIEIDFNDTRPLRHGDYILFGQNTSTGRPILEYIGIESLCSLLLVRTRKPTRSNTGTQGTSTSRGDHTRDTAVRRVVRRRDFQCLVSGTAPQRRVRGDNFTGLEVAHIFALADATPDTLQLMRTNLGNFSEHLISSRPVADHARNAIILRSDIHAFFDDYQFAVDWRPPHRIFRFEKSGAVPLEHCQQLLPPQHEVGVDNAVNPQLFKIHFIFALLMHVAGKGKDLRK